MVWRSWKKNRYSFKELEKLVWWGELKSDIIVLIWTASLTTGFSHNFGLNSMKPQIWTQNGAPRITQDAFYYLLLFFFGEEGCLTYFISTKLSFLSTRDSHFVLRSTECILGLYLSCMYLQIRRRNILKVLPIIFHQLASTLHIFLVKSQWLLSNKFNFVACMSDLITIWDQDISTWSIQSSCFTFKTTLQKCYGTTYQTLKILN